MRVYIVAESIPMKKFFSSMIVKKKKKKKLHWNGHF